VIRLARLARLARALLAALAAGACTPCPSTSTSSSPAPLPEHGLTAEGVARLEALLEEAVAEQRVAGAVALVLKDGAIVWRAAVGDADREAGRPMRHDTLFRIASMTKPITSVAVMMLWEEGRFALDDPIASVLPEFDPDRVLVPLQGDADAPYALVPAERPITIRDLLTHTSGLTYGFNQRPFVSRLYADAGVSDGLVQTEGTQAENVRRLGALPLYQQPGANWEYSLGTDVLGVLVERLSGQGLDVFLRERLFEPLGMHDTWFYPPPEEPGVVGRLAAVYQPDPETRLERMPDGPSGHGTLAIAPDWHVHGPRIFVAGGAGLVSTADDHARFMRMILAGGTTPDGARLLEAETIAFMGTNQVGTLTVGPQGDGFGLGFAIHAGSEVSGRPGPAGELSWGGIFYTSFWLDPSRDLGFVLLAQLFPNAHLGLREEFRTRVYEALDE